MLLCDESCIIMTRYMTTDSFLGVCFMQPPGPYFEQPSLFLNLTNQANWLLLRHIFKLGQCKKWRSHGIPPIVIVTYFRNIRHKIKWDLWSFSTFLPNSVVQWVWALTTNLWVMSSNLAGEWICCMINKYEEGNLKNKSCF